MPNFPPTQQQTNIVNAIKIGSPKILVDAGAGTGKSTLLQFCVEAVPQRANKLYLVFNKSGEIEAQRKFGEYENIQIKTVDAFARWLVLGNSYSRIKNYKIQDMDLLGVPWKKRKVVLEAINQYCNSDKLVPDGKYMNFIQTFFKKIDKGELDKSFGYIIKKAHLGLASGMYSHKVENIYLAMIDEYQDTNNVSKAIFEYIPASIHLKVGDKNQGIYGFRGAYNSMEKEIKDSDAVSFPLTVSYRYTQEIADKANFILSTFKGEKNSLVGKGKVESEIKTRAMLSRTNAKLIYGINRLVTADFKFNTLRKASDIFDMPITLAYLNGVGNFTSKQQWIKENRFNMSYLLKDYQLFLDMKKSGQTFIDWLSKTTFDIEILSSLAIIEEIPLERLLKLEEVSNFNNENYKNRVEFYLSTIHTAKGLEWDSVTIATNDMKSYPYLIAKHIAETYGDIGDVQNGVEMFREDCSNGDVDVKTVEEFNLLYVAITRAKVDLKLPPDIKSLYNIKEVNSAINKAYKEIIKKMYEKNQISFDKDKKIDKKNKFDLRI